MKATQNLSFALTDLTEKQARVLISALINVTVRPNYAYTTDDVSELLWALCAVVPS